MLVRGNTAKRVLVALLVSTLLVVTAGLAVEDVDRTPSSFAGSVSFNVWPFNDSIKALVELTHPSTFLVSFEDGKVQAWGKQNKVALWSFSSGPPLVSFRWFSGKNAFEKEVDAVEWYVEGPEVSFEEDGAFSVSDSFGRKKTLKLTLEDLREGSVHVREGEIIQVDRHNTVFLVDAETGTVVREVGNSDTQDLNLQQQEKKSVFVIRTDYIARASNLSGTSIWSLSYGEIGTLVTGLQTPTTSTVSLSLLPRISISSPGVPYRIAPPLTQSPAIGQAIPEGGYLKPAHNPARFDALALPSVQAPPSLPLLKPALAIWEEHSHSTETYTPAPGMIGSPKPTSGRLLVYTAVAGLLVLGILGSVIKISSVKKVSTPVSKKKRSRKSSPSQLNILASIPEVSNSIINEKRVIKPQVNYGSGTQVGRLFVSDIMIGVGSHGTLVLEGYLDGRKVAVKRLLAQYYEKAQKEIALLIASDEHPNVVRYYATEETADFVYVSLERCSFSLYDLILTQTSQDVSMERQVKECLAGKGLKLRSVEDFNLWDKRGRPSWQLFQIMRDIVAGLAHLHAVGIVHRDLKPHNVLISSGRIMQAKIADMGLSKQLDDDSLSFDTQLTGHGSSGSRGWQAPEQLLRRRGSRAVDIFSLGCVLYHCITGGKHPFGSHLERDGNIAHGKMDLFHIIDFPEAADLIERLLDPDPARRSPAQEILLHPFFWDSEKCLSFLKDASDRVELELDVKDSIILADLESLEPSVLCGGWDGNLDFPLLQNIRGYRRYNFRSVRDLLRVIRNKANHFRELPEHLQGLLGPVPNGLEDYFRSRFPRLLIEVYQVIGHHCRREASFEKYFSKSYIPKFSRLKQEQCLFTW